MNENIFNGIADIYDKYRPSYPHALLIIPELSEPPVRTLGATIPENESHIFR